jgi:PPP family 3-phenylpropionic acid transporter
MWVLVAGRVADWNIRYLFPLSAAIAVLAILVTYRLPPVRGHQTPGNHVSPLLLLKNRPLVLLVSFCFFLMLGIGYYFTFFSIHYQNLGADNELIGLSFMIAAGVEIPFLLFAERIIGRLGIKRTLLLSGLAMGLRWLLLGVFTDLTGILVANVLHGFTLIVVFYCMAVFINREVPKELKSSGQTFFGIFGVSIPQILASVLGGVANDAFGMQRVFLAIGLFTLASVGVFAALFFWLWRREPKIVPTTADLPL